MPTDSVHATEIPEVIGKFIATDMRLRKISRATESDVSLTAQLASSRM